MLKYKEKFANDLQKSSNNDTNTNNKNPFTTRDKTLNDTS